LESQSFGRVLLLCLGVLLIALGWSADAQESKKIPRVGVLVAGQPPTRPRWKGFARDCAIWATWKAKTSSLNCAGTKEVRIGGPSSQVRSKVDVILAGHGAAALGAKQATTTIPIVIGAAGGDPVAAGLVTSLARPGGNITGLAFYGSELSPKRLELLKETLPRLSRAAMAWHPFALNLEVVLKEIKVTAQSLGLTLQPLEVRQKQDLDSAFQTARQKQAGAMLISQGALFGTHRAYIADLGLRYRLPTISGEAEFAEAGGLMFYGQNIPNTWRRAAVYVDKILKGAKPADLPVEQPTKFELVINLKTAKQIGLTIPPNVLARADKVIK
jgi:ABC-type uncharacterized transport system substrate-binding protein